MEKETLERMAEGYPQLPVLTGQEAEAVLAEAARTISSLTEAKRDDEESLADLLLASFVAERGAHVTGGVFRETVAGLRDAPLTYMLLTGFVNRWPVGHMEIYATEVIKRADAMAELKPLLEVDQDTLAVIGERYPEFRELTEEDRAGAVALILRESGKLNAIEWEGKGVETTVADYLIKNGATMDIANLMERLARVEKETLLIMPTRPGFREWGGARIMAYLAEIQKRARKFRDAPTIRVYIL